MLRFKAMPEQVSQMAANACQHSKAVGIGRLHFNPDTVFKAEHFPVGLGAAINLDYVQGRMVKLNIWSEAEDVWKMRDKADPEYQSWCRKYPTARSLIESAGGVVIE